MTPHQPLLGEIERLTKLGKEGYKIYIDELAEKEQKPPQSLAVTRAVFKIVSHILFTSPEKE